MRGKTSWSYWICSARNKPEIAGLEKPVLDELRPEKDFTRRPPPGGEIELHRRSAGTAQFAPGADTQEIKFAAPATGKYFCLESMSA